MAKRDNLVSTPSRVSIPSNQLCSWWQGRGAWSGHALKSLFCLWPIASDLQTSGADFTSPSHHKQPLQNTVKEVRLTTGSHFLPFNRGASQAGDSIGERWKVAFELWTTKAPIAYRSWIGPPLGMWSQTPVMGDNGPSYLSRLARGMQSIQFLFWRDCKRLTMLACKCVSQTQLFTCLPCPSKWSRYTQTQDVTEYWADWVKEFFLTLWRPRH
jgi:hypothetical protein